MDKETIAKEIDSDMINEVGNILSNNSANVFSKMLKENININTKVDFISTNNFNMEWILAEDFSKIFNDVAHNFAEGYFLKTVEGIEGISVLFFVKEHIKDLIEHISLGMGLNENSLAEEQKEEILKEFTSICLNAYLSALSNLIETRISSTTPIPAKDILGSLYDFREHLKEANEEKALMIRTDILAKETGITGKLVMLLEPTSLKKIVDVLEKKASGDYSQS